MPDNPNHGVCQYVCSYGVWTNVLNDPDNGYYCPPTYGTCGGYQSTYIPPIPSGNTARMLERPAVPKNGADYVWTKGSKSLRLQRGSCKKGHCLLPDIPLKQLKDLAPEIYALIESAKASKAVKELVVFVPSQPIELPQKA